MKTRKLQNSKFIRQETTQPYTHRIANPFGRLSPSTSPGIAQTTVDLQTIDVTSRWKEVNSFNRLRWSIPL